MQVVAGPSGSGKSSLFPVAAAGVDHFNVDDRCAQLNRGSYLGITPDNSRRGKPPVRVLEAAAGRVTFQVGRLPTWLRDLVRGSELA